MSTLDVVGYARKLGRAVIIVESNSIEDLPRIIEVPSARFVLLLAYDHGKTPARLVSALTRLLDDGCAYLCTWGDGCEHVHDTMDDIVLERELAGGPQQAIMTTWHDKDTLEEAVSFTLQWAIPDETLLDGCDVVVLAAVGNEGWAAQLREAARQYLK